ncbi:MFS general substrate transporter [Sistotremastrum suecicum HHB10207 ss-3]|uniref:MFS general substrate transporter n=1 Tax=Sistotremastrum suecicum HHB10207 ss-3 TaxID=1314776 RepID=A0A166CPA7_9AGAM|nr:MFS general substrate transporter [Sistotremastrum suecicum HHB10207 ss-3]
MNYVGRTNISSARLKGLQKDLHLTDLQFDTVLAVLYASYCSAQIPSNMVLIATRPSVYISICIVLWGIVSASTAAAQNFTGILLCRIFIGLPESAFYPGAIYLLSRWYTRKELALRSAIIYAGLLISNAFGSLMAAGILSDMDGNRGIQGWRWLFIIEGSITCFIGFCALYILPDHPHSTRWISPEERHLAQVRLAEDAAEADKDYAEDSAWSGFKQAIFDPKVPIFALMTCSLLLGLSFVNFFPTLTATLGFDTTVSLLLAAPPWIFATVVCLLNAWHCDRSDERFFHIAGPWWAVIIGFIISLATRSTGARYFSMFLMSGGYAGAALVLVWVSNAVPRPPAKRAAAIGIVNGFGNIGTLIGSYAWKAAWSPFYHPSMWISLSAIVFSSFLAFAIRCLLRRENRQLEEDQVKQLSESSRARIEEAAKLEGISFQQALDRKRGFRYLY